MSSSARRGLAAAVAAGLLAVALAGCGTSSSAASYFVKPNNANAQIGHILVRGGMLVRGTASDASLVVTLADADNSDDVLQKVSVGEPLQAPEGASPAAAGSAPVEVSPNVTVAAGGAVHLGVAGASPVVLKGFTAPAGSVVPVTLTFRDSGVLTLSMLVQEATGDYAQYAPGATPPTLTAPPTSTAAPSPGPTPSSAEELPTSPSPTASP